MIAPPHITNKEFDSRVDAPVMFEGLLYLLHFSFGNNKLHSTCRFSIFVAYTRATKYIYGVLNEWKNVLCSTRSYRGDAKIRRNETETIWYINSLDKTTMHQ